MLIGMEEQKVKRFRFLPGLAGLFVGFFAWFFLSVIFGLAWGVTGHKSGHFLLAASFGVMVLVPLWYWILRIPYAIGKEKGKAWMKITPLVVWWLAFVLMLSVALSG